MIGNHVTPYWLHVLFTFFIVVWVHPLSQLIDLLYFSLYQTYIFISCFAMSGWSPFYFVCIKYLPGTTLIGCDVISGTCRYVLFRNYLQFRSIFLFDITHLACKLTIFSLVFICMFCFFYLVHLSLINSESTPSRYVVNQ